MSLSGTDQTNGNKEHVEIELGKFDASNTVDDDGNAKNDHELDLGVTSPTRSVLARKKISFESQYSISNIDDHKVWKSNKAEIMEADHPQQHCNIISNDDLNDSQIQLEKLLFPPATSGSDSSKSFTRHISLSNVPRARIYPFVRVHSSGEVLDSSKSVRFSHQGDENFRAPTGQSYYQQQQHFNFPSKFLDENESHEIWKPSKAKARRISLAAHSLRSVSPSPQALHPSSNDQQDETTSLSDRRAPSPIMTSKDLRLRQQQLLERIALAREVSKDQNVKLLSHINDCDTTQCAPRNKFQHMVNAALVQKQSSTTGSRAKLRWKKAVFLSRDHSNTVGPVTAVKLASKQHIIRYPSQDQRSVKKPFLGTTPQSRSEYHLTPSSPSARSTLKTHATCALIDTSSPRLNVSEGVSVDVNPVSFQNVDRTSSCEMATPSIHEEGGITVDIVNNNRCSDFGDSDSEAGDLDECNSSIGCSWSGYDTTSTTVTSVIGTPLQEEINTASHTKFTRSTALDVDQCSTVAKHSSAFHSRQSQFSDNLSPRGVEVIDKLTTNYRPYSHSSTTGSHANLINSKRRPRSSTPSNSNVKSFQTENETTVVKDSDDHNCSKFTESLSQRSTINLPYSHRPILSASSVVPQVVTAKASFDNTSESDIISHISSDITSLFAGQQEHRHNERCLSTQL